MAEKLSGEDIKTSYREKTFPTLLCYVTFSSYVAIVYKLTNKPRDNAKNKIACIKFYSAFILNMVSYN